MTSVFPHVFSQDATPLHRLLWSGESHSFRALNLAMNVHNE